MSNDVHIVSIMCLLKVFCLGLVGQMNIVEKDILAQEVIRHINIRMMVNQMIVPILKNIVGGIYVGNIENTGLMENK